LQVDVGQPPGQLGLGPAALEQAAAPLVDGAVELVALQLDGAAQELDLGVGRDRRGQGRQVGAGLPGVVAPQGVAGRRQQDRRVARRPA
jgi:hypothetical protein